MLFLWVISMNSQEKIPFINSEKLFNSAEQFAGNGDFKMAITYLDSIHPNDSIYLNSIKNKSYYLLQMDQYKEVIKVSDSGIAFKTMRESKATFYINKVVAYLQMKEYEKAFNLIEEALKKYPVEPLLYYNKGVALDNLKRREEAAKALYQCIIYSPFFPSAHLYLGNLSYRQGMFAQALMSFNFYILLEDDEESSFQILKSLNANVKTKYPEKNPEVSLSKDDHNFKGIDQILNSHIALNDRYKIENEITIPLNKQNHAFLSQIASIKKADDFWGNYYVPLYEWINRNNLYHNFTYTLCASIKNPQYKEIIQKKTKDIQSFLTAFYREWIRLIRRQKVVIDGKETVLYSNFNNNDEVISLGPFDGEKVHGEWRYFYDSGEISAVGSYDDNEERDGLWSWYHINGQLKESTFYEHGKIQKNSISYYKNGQLQSKAKFKDNQLNGEYIRYHLGGALQQKKYFKNGVLEGPYRSYFSVGESMVEYEADYVDDKIVKKLIEYYSNGSIFKESTYSEGKLQQEKQYYIDGSLWEEKNYINGTLEGPYRRYHKNKQLAEESQLTNNEWDGQVKTYHTNGLLERQFEYEKGTLNGQYTAYDSDGKVHYEHTFRKGEFIAYRYFDKEGIVIKEGKKKAGEFEFEGYNRNGSITSTGTYDSSGGRKGLWSFYSEYGVLSERGNYTDDEPDGKQTGYYQDGSVYYQSEYVKGQLNGFYVEYYPNGKMKSQGYYMDGEAHGEWRYYRKDGSISSTAYFHKGQQNGTADFFSVEGKLVDKVFTDFGQITKEIEYDTKGDSSVVFDIHHFAGTDVKELITSSYENGQTYSLLTYVNKIKHGPYKSFYFDGKLLSEGNYTNNQLDGKYHIYFEDGTTKSEYNYLNGNLHGEQIIYHENGQIAQKDFYDYGQTHGRDISYYDNGVMSHDRTFVYGKLHGRYAFYDDSGALQLIRHYHDDKLIGYSYHDSSGKEIEMIPLKHGSGKVKAYFDNGNVSREMEFFNGKLVNNYKAYYYNGTLEQEMKFVNGSYNGKIIEYHSNGKVKTEKNYLYDDLHGISKTYYKNGQLKDSQNYLYDEKSGEGKLYSKEGTLLKEVVYFNGEVISQKTY